MSIFESKFFYNFFHLLTKPCVLSQPFAWQHSNLNSRQYSFFRHSTTWPLLQFINMQIVSCPCILGGTVSSQLTSLLLGQIDVRQEVFFIGLIILFLLVKNGFLIISLFLLFLIPDTLLLFSIARLYQLNCYCWLHLSWYCSHQMATVLFPFWLYTSLYMEIVTHQFNSN